MNSPHPFPAPGYSCPPLPPAFLLCQGTSIIPAWVSPARLDAPPQPASAYSGVKSNATPTSFITHLEKTPTTLSHVKENQGGAM